MKDLIPSKITEEQEEKFINLYSDILLEYKFLGEKGFSPEIALELMKIRRMQ